MARISDVDLTLTLPKREAEQQLRMAQRRLLALRLQSGGLLGDGRLGPPLCVVFEGWDAAGKGGAIRRLTAALDPRHVRAAEFAAPTERAAPVLRARGSATRSSDGRLNRRGLAQPAHTARPTSGRCTTCCVIPTTSTHHGG